MMRRKNWKWEWKPKTWKNIPIPYRCVDCPYPRVGFVCYGKDGSCMRTDMEIIAARQFLSKVCS